MMLHLYVLLMRLLQPLLRYKLRRRGRMESGYLEAQEERFGRYVLPYVQAPGTQPLVWLHAVSLGETRTAAILVAALRARWPGLRLLLTHSTATGRAEGLRLLRPGDQQTWLPWDTPAAVDAFLDRFRPAMGILIETEVWPLLMQRCRQLNLPVALVNARLNERSFRRARWLSVLARPAYAGLSLVLAQTDADAARLVTLGAKVDGAFGSLKFDAKPDAAQLERGRAWRQRSERAVLMFASSREGEETILLDALASGPGSVLDPRQANVGASKPRWLVVPRHPQRFEEVQRLFQARGFSVSRCSGWRDGPDAQALACDVWLGDSMGEMALYYGMGDLALLGGSFAPLGGQNLIEAAACGCPVVMGPHTFNFAEAAHQAVKAGAAFEVAGMEAALRMLRRLQQDNAARAAAVAACASFMQAHRGCTERTVAALAPLLKHRRDRR